jgi:hypothetical protein
MDGNFWLAKEDMSTETRTFVAQLKMKPNMNMTYHKTAGDNVVC